MKLFGSLFDFNGDGKTDGAEWMLGMHLMEGDREERSSRAGERGIEIEIEIGGEDADDDLRERQRSRRWLPCHRYLPSQRCNSLCSQCPLNFQDFLRRSTHPH